MRRVKEEGAERHDWTATEMLMQRKTKKLAVRAVVLLNLLFEMKAVAAMMMPMSSRGGQGFDHALQWPLIERLPLLHPAPNAILPPARTSTAYLHSHHQHQQLRCRVQQEQEQEQEQEQQEQQEEEQHQQQSRLEHTVQQKNHFCL